MIQKEENICGDGHIEDEQAEDEDYQPPEDSKEQEQPIEKPPLGPLEAEEGRNTIQEANDEL